MDAYKAMISNLFNSSTLIEVPFFQRSYVWDEDLWDRFLDDMEYVSITKKPHFLGSIILKKSQIPKDEYGITDCRTVVDGQQRITTFLIFLKALCIKFDQTIFDFQFRIQGGRIAFRHGKNDIKAFERVMEANVAEPITDFTQESKIINAFNYFVSAISKKSLDKYSITTIMHNAIFVRIDLGEEEDEQQIFDTLNSLGVNLTTSELLKNYLFNRNTIDEYNSKWASVFEKDDETRQYWDTIIETGRIKRALIDLFFDAYFQLFIQDKQYKISLEDKIMYARVDNLAQSFQHFVKNYCNGDKNVILNPLKTYATIFRETFNPDFCNSQIPAAPGIERLNVIIFGLKTSTLIPYTLYIAKNVVDHDDLNAMYATLESYIMRRIIVHASTKNYNNLFTSLILNSVLDSKTLIEKLKSGSDATTFVPDDNELDNGFRTSKLINLQSKGIIYLIESKIRPYNSATALLGFNGYSLEHLMPKKWRNNWTPCSTPELSDKRDSLLQTLGNLAIITQSLNASIRDANWSVKKVGKGDSKPGLDICAAGLSTMYDVLQKDEWTETDIQDRAAWFSNKAKDIWRL